MANDTIVGENLSNSPYQELLTKHMLLQQEVQMLKQQLFELDLLYKSIAQAIFNYEAVSKVR